MIKSAQDILNLKIGNELDSVVSKHIMDKDDSEKIENYSRNINKALEIFYKLLDPNRTSIHPCGNGAEGLWWAVAYDDVFVATGKELPEALWKYCLIVKRFPDYIWDRVNQLKGE